MDLLKLAITCSLIFQSEGRIGVDQFLKSFVENEGKPTMVVFHGICWKNSGKVHVMKELSKAGIRTAPSMSKGGSFQDHAVLLLTDLACPGTADLFQNATHRQLQRLPYRWLALSDAPATDLPLWSHFLVDSDLVVATADETGYTMTEVHKPAPNMSAILKPRGMFRNVLTDVRPSRELYRRRNDIMGAPVVMSNIIQDSNSSKYHLLQEDYLVLQHDLIAKNSWTIAKLGMLMLNATPIATFNYRYGFIKDGRWNGLIQDLIDYKADITTNIGMTVPRLKVVTFIDSLDNNRIRFVFRQPALSLTANIFSLPFSSGVWIAIVILSFSAAAAFCLSMRAIGTGDGSGEIVRDAFLMTMGALSQQGCDIQPNNISARIILWVLFTSLMAIYVAYSAYIVVLLQAPSSSVNNLAQLANSKMRLAACDVDYNNFLLIVGADPVRNEISRKIRPTNGPKAFYNMTEGVEKIRKGQFAFHCLVEPVYRQIEKTFQEHEKCDLVEIDFIGFNGLYSAATRDSPYLELLRVTFRWLREVGIKSAINFRYEVRKPKCKDSGAIFSSVGVTEIEPVLIFMSYGVTLSVVVLVMEHVVFRINHYRVRRHRIAKRLVARRN